jgi:predicted component of type VI protein secretion system
MMSIRVVSREGEVPATPLAATFGEAGGDIGRGIDCTLVLPDPERRISRKHALVSCRGGRHFIRQLGSSVAVVVDGAPLGPDAEQPLDAGSEIQIGPYLLEAAEEQAIDVPITITPVMPPPADGIDLVLGETEPAPLGPHIEALYRGLGVPMPAAPSAEQLELIGALLRSAVEGTLDLLAARNVAKRELGANPTLLQTRENNPLKFSPDVDAALGHLLGPGQRGFVAPRIAVREAFDDLRAHEMAVLAGMRAALDAVLARFDPLALEQRLAPKAAWSNLLPAAGKARLWERYGEQYAQILREIEGDFDSLFGRAFLDAYRAQLDELAGAKER